MTVGADDTTPSSEEGPVPDGAVDLKARISGELNFTLSALNGVGTVIETFSSHFDFGTLDMGVFNKYGSDSTGAIAIFLWGSSHGTPTFWL